MLTHTSFCLGPFATNAYVIADPASREAAVLDVGFDPEGVVAHVREAGLTVRHVLATHGHYDHVAAMRQVQAELGGLFWLHPADRFLLDGLATQGAAFGLPAARPPEEIHDIADGQRFALGEESLETLLTPGHSPGSVTFRWKNHLWAGDILFAGSIGRTDLPGGSFETLEGSVRERLFPLGDDLIVHPGHGPDTTLGIERRMNPFVGEARLA